MLMGDNRNGINVLVEVDWMVGGETILSLCHTRSSGDRGQSLGAVADDLRDLAVKLDRMAEEEDDRLLAARAISGEERPDA